MPDFQRDIEKALVARDDVLSVRAIDYGSEGPVLILVQPDVYSSGPDLRDECARILNGAADRIVVALVSDIPPLDSGIPDPAVLLVSAVSSYRYEPPSTHTEQILTAIWNDVLGREQTGVLDDFLDLGGDSIAAIQAVNRINDEFNVAIDVALFFETASVRELAGVIDGGA
jgi:acyl carrier protein